MNRIFTLALALVMSVAVMAADKVTTCFKVSPEMSCQNCENKIKTNLRYEKGVKEINTSLADQVVTVSYDPAKTSAEKLVAAFKKIGYTATVTTGSCKKDEGCKKAEGGCCKKAEAGCKKADGCKTAEGGCCKKAEAGCKKAEDCKKTEGCKKAEGCKKTEGGCCKK